MTKDKSKKNYDPKEFKLTRVEIEKLYKISEQFKEINLFTLVQDHSSGIGCSTKVKFDLFESNDVNIDVTDTGSW
jgi:hypothetical protein